MCMCKARKFHNAFFALKIEEGGKRIFHICSFEMCTMYIFNIKLSISETDLSLNACHVSENLYLSFVKSFNGL